MFYYYYLSIINILLAQIAYYYYDTHSTLEYTIRVLQTDRVVIIHGRGNLLAKAAFNINNDIKCCSHKFMSSESVDGSF